MPSLMPFPDAPFLSLLLLAVLLMIFMYFAREPMQHVFKTLAQAVSGGLYLVADWARRTGDDVAERNRELVAEAGLAAQQARLGEEFRRLETSYAKQLADYPKLQRRLDEQLTEIESDFEASAEVPPEIPGWSQVVESIANVKGVGDDAVRRMLDDLHESAVAGEKHALKEYRAATAKRHKVLAGMAPLWKELKGVLDRVRRVVSDLLESTRRIDGFMDRYEALLAGDERAVRSVASSATKLFLVSVFVIAIAAGAAFINFQLIALPMSELVPGGSRLIGVPVATVAALVIVLMEVAAGIFLLDTLGITNLFPQLANLSRSRRRLVFGVAFAGLFLLAAIEASLAVLREQLVEAEMALMESLAATGAEAIAEASVSWIPVVGQAVLGFTLPWILALIAIPLEMLIESGRFVLGRAVVGILLGFGLVMRSIAFVFQYLVLLVAHLYDAVIMIPVQVESWIRKENATRRTSLTVADLAPAGTRHALAPHADTSRVPEAELEAASDQEEAPAAETKRRRRSKRGAAPSSVAEEASS